MTRLRDVFDALDDFAAHEREYAEFAARTSGDRGHRCAYGRRLIIEIVHQRFCRRAKSARLEEEAQECDYWINATHLFLCNNPGWGGSDEELWQYALSTRDEWNRYDLDVVAERWEYDIRHSKDSRRPQFVQSC